MASKRGRKPGSKNKKKKAEAQTTWTTGTNPKPVDQAAAAQEPTTREKHGKPYTRELPTEATAAELSILAHELADVLDEEALVKKQRRDAMAGFREKLSAFDDKKKKLSECVKTDRKLAQVKVQEFIRSDNLIEVVRMDTGDVVESRPATSDDLQREIQADGVHEKANHKPLVESPDADDEEDEDEACPECGGENDVHSDECSHVAHVETRATTEPAPAPPEGTETEDLARDTAAT